MLDNVNDVREFTEQDVGIHLSGIPESTDRIPFGAKEEPQKFPDVDATIVQPEIEPLNLSRNRRRSDGNLTQLPLITDEEDDFHDSAIQANRIIRGANDTSVEDTTSDDESLTSGEEVMAQLFPGDRRFTRSTNKKQGNKVNNLSNGKTKVGKQGKGKKSR